MSDQLGIQRPGNSEILKGYRILVVDDEEDVRTFILTVFADAGAQICEAEDGAEAIAMAKKYSPDLITLDLAMPNHDGVSAVNEIRRTPGIEEVPICIITGHPEMRSLVYDRPPPEGFLTKPIDPEMLVATVRRILTLKKRKRQSESPLSSPSPA